MTADEQCLLGFADKRHPAVASRIVVHFDRQAGQFPVEPVACLQPGVGPRDALCAVLVLSQRTKLFEVGYGSPRITVHGAPDADLASPIPFEWRSRTRTPKKQHVAVHILEFESTQAVMRIFEWLGKLDIARRELCRQRVGIGDIEVGVPAGDAFLDVSRVIRHGIHADVLEHDHRGATSDNAEKDIVRFGSLKRDVESETVAIKRQRGWDTPDDEEWRNAGDFWL